MKMKSPLKGSSECKKCSSPKQTTRSQKNSVQGQGSSVKLKIPFEAVRRRKSIKLGRERTFVRKKSFLKKGDGFSARRPLHETKRTEKDDSLETKATDTGRTRSTTFGKKLNDNSGRISLDEKKDNVNPTFLLGETAGMKYSRKATRDTCSGPVITRKAHSKVPAFDNSESTDPRSRRRWSENGVQTYEGMIFSTMFAFSEELKESSDIIHSKLQALYDSTNKSKACSMFSKKSNGRSKEWRQNNRELLDSGSQEIAGTFSNLRKVESNLKTVDQAVSILLKEKSRTKERITGFSKPS
ncbi:uncharacterized protein LOC114522200 [Dendronephthya gigantea]|uniref:uncharacterized protein LOC114522200 n=1 Tax=Dendronephthya gigantea TaxID=151771 RepID=UPI00106DD225|nr:uncharacterized protein LOC114522200 [Dendronephthya gigantea]